MKKGILIVWGLLFLLSCQKSLSEDEIQNYRNQGDQIVKSAGGKLSSTLMAKMKEGGINEAISFCNQSALPITHKMSTYHGVQIKRTSLQLRNSENQPDAQEIKTLNDFEKKKNTGEALTPLVSLDPAGNPNYYAPILVQKKCLICHGKLDKELSRAVDSLIKSKYPNDLATGYSEGDLRGIWSIEFKADLP